MHFHHIFPTRICCPRLDFVCFGFYSCYIGVSVFVWLGFCLLAPAETELMINYMANYMFFLCGYHVTNHGNRIKH